MKGMGRDSTYGSAQPGTGSLYEIAIQGNLLTDSSMFTESYIQDLKYLDISNNKFRHFPLAEENDPDNQCVGYSCMGLSDRNQRLPNKIEMLIAHNTGPNPYMSGSLPTNLTDDDLLGECGCHTGGLFGTANARLSDAPTEDFGTHLPDHLVYENANLAHARSLSTSRWNGQVYKDFCRGTHNSGHWRGYPFQDSGFAWSMRGLSGSAHQNNFSSSFRCTAGWSSELRVMTLDNTHIEGVQPFNTARKLEVLSAAACSMSKVDVTQCGNLRVLSLPYQGGGRTHMISNPYGAGNVCNGHNLHTSTLTELTMSSYNWAMTQYGVNPEETVSSQTGHAYLNHLNLWGNMDLLTVDLRGIDIWNWSQSMQIYDSLTSGGGSVNTDINKNRFNLMHCGRNVAGYRQFNIIVKDSTTKSMIETRRGETVQYPFCIPTWATISVI